MRSLFRKMHKGEKGFTLVELLVVFTLLGVLAAIMLPNVSQFLGYGHQNAAATELSVIQTAMDAMMAEQDIALVGAVSSNTTDMQSFPGAPGTALSPNYLRSRYTHGSYEVTADGTVEQHTTGYADLDD